jgi:predicted metalloprotease
LNRPIYNAKGKIISYEKCGRDNIKEKTKYPLCRPLTRINSRTPLTVRELTKKQISRAKKSKARVKSSKNIKF